MQIHKTHLYPRCRLTVPWHVYGTLVCIAVIAPLHALGVAGQQPFEQQFVVTAYYSPQPDQCCYVKGGYEADKVLNGQGHTAADGTNVYPGMIAAPPRYPPGTKIVLPGLGTFTVHDRGGAIQQLPDGSDRLDIWAGRGEEGLARSLEFGLQRIRGTVYPPGTEQPQTHFDSERLPAPVSKLRRYFVEGPGLLPLEPKRGEEGLSVSLLQEQLKTLGYFRHAVTGLFGPVTQESLQSFMRDYGLDAPADRLTESVAAHLRAAVRRLEARKPFRTFVDEGSSPAAVSEAQRILRFLGYYDGRTDGEYDEKLEESILRFQLEYGVIGSRDVAGAGRIGPRTRRTLRAAWNRRLVSGLAEEYITLHRVEEQAAKEGKRLEHFLGRGYGGNQVRLLQQLLAERGFFPEESINGHFGPLTQESVLEYQLDRGIVTKASDNGAGYVGPATLRQLRKEERLKRYRLVRAEGWDAL